MPHRSESSHHHPRLRHPQYYDDLHARPRSRQSGRSSHHHQSRRPSSSYDDLDANQYRQPPREYTPRPRPSSYHPANRPDMYAAPKPTYPIVSSYPPLRRESPPSGIVARRRYDEDATSDYASSDSDPPRHARMSHSKRHSTFPPSAYYNSPQQKQVQPYQRPYVHPALPPPSPTLAPAPNLQRSLTQYAPYPTAAYEAPTHTYQPPTADPPRPQQPIRADSWAHSDSDSIRDGRHGLSRRGSRSVPPASRASQDGARERGHDAPPTPWKKAKKMINDPTANHTAELALFGLLAVAKAL